MKFPGKADNDNFTCTERSLSPYDRRRAKQFGTELFIMLLKFQQKEFVENGQHLDAIRMRYKIRDQIESMYRDGLM